MINYRKIRVGMYKAYRKYCSVRQSRSVLSFVAGWNACLAHIKAEEEKKRQEKSS